MRILIAPDHFGGALSAVHAAAALAAPWQQDDHDTIVRPMSDGGTGLVEVVHHARGGVLVPVNVPGAAGTDVPAAVLHVPGPGGGTAYIEPGAVLGGLGEAGATESQAAAGGSSAGVADLLHAAAQTGAGRIVVGLGTTPTHDGGAGMLARLAELCTPSAAPPDPVWHALGPVRDRFARTDLVVAVARDTPLLGLHGAGARLQRFGLSAAQAQEVERRTADLAHGAFDHARTLPPLRTGLTGPDDVSGASDLSGPGSAYTGAGGGVGYMLGLLGARLLPGAGVVAGELALREALATADLVLTGTASLDNDTMYEGVVATVGELTADFGRPVVALAHEVMANRRELANAGLSAAYPLIDRPLVPGRAPAPRAPLDPAEALRARAARVMRNWTPR